MSLHSISHLAPVTTSGTPPIVLPAAIPPQEFKVKWVLVLPSTFGHKILHLLERTILGITRRTGNEEARFLLNAPMGGAGAQIHNFTNVAPAFTSGVQTVGNGYLYQQDQSTAGTVNSGYWNGVLTVTNSPATAATTGCMYFYVYYNCVGLQS